jgi:hypothetical protein
VRLSWIDAAHVYVGLVGGVFVAAKVWRVRFHYRVVGVPEVVPWQRWVSWSLLVLYSAIFLSGVLALLPIKGRLYADVVNFHLLTSVWAIAPTTWHVWHYRRRATPFLTRILPRGRTVRYWAGVGLAVLPALVAVGYPRAISQLPQVMGGSVWTQSALNGSYLDRIVTRPDGTLIAAGDALYISRDGTVWTQIDIPGVPLPPSANPSPSVHQHGAPTGKNLGVSLAVTGGTIFVGASSGLYRTDTGTGPLVEVGFVGQTVSALAIDPSSPASIWAASSSGLMHSTNGGATWAQAGSGLTKPTGVEALAFMAGSLFASDSTGIFENSADQGAWQRVASQTSVIDMTPSPDGRYLYSTSTTTGVEVFDGHVWRNTDSLASPHQHHTANEGAHPEVLSLASVDGRLYAVGTAFGVSASADGGQTWTQLGGGLADVTPAQAVGFQNSLLAATSNGVFTFPLRSDPPASAGWWLAVLASVAACGAAAVLVVGLDRLPRARVTTRKQSKSRGE